MLYFVTLKVSVCVSVCLSVRLCVCMPVFFDILAVVDISVYYMTDTVCYHIIQLISGKHQH